MQQKGKDVAHEMDLRVRRSRKFLQDALIDLMSERSFDSITIADIAEKAMVNRATFYRHYRDKYHLAETVFEEAVNAMIAAVGSVDEPLAEKAKSREIGEAWVFLFTHVAEHARLYRTLFGGEGNVAFVRHIRDHLVPIIKRRTESRIKLNQTVRGTSLPRKPPTTDLPYIFVANLLIGNLSWWLDDGKGFERDQVIEWTRRLIRHGFPGLFRDYRWGGPRGDSDR